MQQQKPVLISVVGPTAVGKTAVAIAIAKRFQTEIVSCDSRQFYRELEIGTAKPTAAELAEAKHHFINNLAITDYYSVGRFEQEAIQQLELLFQKHEVVVMVGGSGLYCQAIWKGIDDMPAVDDQVRAELNQLFEDQGIIPLQEELKASDPEYYDVVDKQNHARLIRALEVIRSTGKTFTSFRTGEKLAERPFDMLHIGLEMDRERLYSRIDARMDQMIEDGLFEEAEKYHNVRHLNALRTVGYQEIYGYMEDEYDREEAIRLLKRNSRRYAKRQLTWFKKENTIHWFSMNDPVNGTEKIIDFISVRLA
jgi:tRNA dimethylallyltransferase